MAKKGTLIELTEVVPEIQGIKRVRDAATLLDNYPLYRPAREFTQAVIDCFSENGLPLNIFGIIGKAVSLQTEKEKVLLAKDKKYYFGYSFLEEEGMRMFSVRADLAKRVPQLWPDILLGDIQKNELVPLNVFIDDRIITISYRSRFPFFGEVRLS